MAKKQNRRSFLKNCTQYGFSCMALFLWNKNLLASDNDSTKTDTKKVIIDPKQLSYCGIACHKACGLYKATKENNIELKKKFYNQWNWKEKFKIDFDPEKVFCYGCKPGEKPLKIGMDKCAVRMCAIENKMESCIQCSKLDKCDKDLWKNWPDFHNNIKQLQKQYLSQTGAEFIDIKTLN